ncbi:filamentous hemagglutinin N-terminal domain-containing protein [Variovorax sp. J22R115]|uniref:two-partner secretion domain-containing protein n=1 Tax=Variovorax sp. J22R115 TaxID=3053509 RepID=UPI0025752B2F|nr:filamentous hemagglutinin N-terminal domain-containing protein [Variovorax sp. J22R115]MDM0053042.1 filamentous hemagglutinin N-terminal domain-containing protein [Variovorax sp. J22R115]
MKQRMHERSTLCTGGQVGDLFKRTPLSRGVRHALACLAGATLFGAAHANPVGGAVVMGQAQIAQPSMGQMHITQATDRAIINWRSFGIAAGESVRFMQPSTSSAMLNRVVGNDPSTILGTLSANGHVYLVNQNGVFIGRDAQIDVAGLVLSTANISNANFMSGRMNFDQPGKPGASIINEGRITAAQSGLVAMVAPGVENRGVISARLGQVMLAGAKTFSLDLYGDGLVNIAIKPADLADIADAGGTPLAHYVNNSGQITAEGGRVWLSAATARGVVDGSVNVAGGIRATREANRGGDITLLGGEKLDISGTVDATGVAEGGRISASATHVVLGSTAVLDASGGTRGGTVLVGGSYRGESPAPGAQTTARSLEVASGARVKADAAGPVGDGGTTVLWSEDSTRFLGSASARAGAAGGDGGLMEVSGKRHLLFEGQADASAAQGRPGTLLLDPGSLTVADLGGGGFSAFGIDSTVAARTINAVLARGTSVLLRADDGISINSQIDSRSLPAIGGAGLRLEAGGLVAVNAPIVLNNGDFTSTSGSFRQAPNNVIATQGARSISITARGDVDTQYLVTTGDVSLSSTAGNVRANQSLGGEILGMSQPLATLSVSAPLGTASVTRGLETRGNATFRAANVELGQAIVGGLRAGSPGEPIGSFSMVGAAGGPPPQIDAGPQGVAVNASSIGALGTIRSAGDIDLAAARGDIRLGTLESTGAGRVAVSSAGAIDLPESASIFTQGGDVTLNAAGGHIQTLGTVGANDPATVAAAPRAGNITLGAYGDVGVRQLVAFGRVGVTSSAGSVTLNQSLGGTDDQHPVVGSLDIRAARDVTTNGLNLAGAAIGDGLRIEAGTGGQEGHIFVNDRIGVSNGDLHFGPQTAREDLGNKGFSAVLQQGVYARNGNQNITFNVPVVVDGARINAFWRSLVPSANPVAPLQISPELSERLVDTLFIPVDQGTFFNLNPDAELLVSKDGGGLRVDIDRTSGRVIQILPSVLPSVFPSDPKDVRGFWMIPKIVISNQENPRPGDSGKITLNGAPTSTASPSGSNTAAIKVIVPSTAEERAINLNSNGNDGNVSRRQFTRDVASNTADSRPTNFILNKNGQRSAVEYRQESPSGFTNAILVTNETVTLGQTLQQTDSLPISVIIYPGRLGLGTTGDNIGPFPGRELGFHSNSIPIGFISPVGYGGSPTVDLSAQILAALPPVAGAGGFDIPVGLATATSGGPGERDVVATAEAIETRASQPQEPLCPGRDRRVVGRSAGDEADIGETSALLGAPRPVFATTYALGEVSERLQTADGRAIGGGRGDALCF